MKNISDIYDSALAIINQRGQNYGGVEDNFERAAVIASMKLNVMVSAYDIAVIMESVKDARRAVDPTHIDSHIDGLNYRAFAMMLAPVKEKKEKPAPAKASAPTPKAPAPAPKPPAPVKRGRGRPPKAK